MWYIKNYTEYNNTKNCDFSSFNRIKRSSLVRSDDAVETSECHVEYGQSAAQDGAPLYHSDDRREPKRTGREIHLINMTNLFHQAWKK